MVHFQNTLIALRAMVTSVRFGFEAPLTNAESSLFLLLNFNLLNTLILGFILLILFNEIRNEWSFPS